MKRIKKYIKIALFCTTTLIIKGNGVAQGMPVYDNVNFISFAKQLLEAGKQTSNIIKTMKFLKQQKENIEKVSKAVEQLKTVRNMIRNNERLYNMVRNDLRNILNSPYIRADEVERVSESFNRIIENSMSDLEMINELLSSGHLKLSDADRMKAIDEREARSREMVVEIERKTQRYRDIIAFRELQDRINNRETNY